MDFGLRPTRGLSGAAARSSLKMIHWIIFRALRTPLDSFGAVTFYNNTAEKKMMITQPQAFSPAALRTAGRGR